MGAFDKQLAAARKRAALVEHRGNTSTLFKTVYMDPPWYESGGAQKAPSYPLIKTPDMLPTITHCGLWSIAPDAHCYMWVTNNFLEDGLRLLSRLGFRYVSNLCWVKHRVGIGQYFRGQHELCLFGVRGRGVAVVTEARNIPTVLDPLNTLGARRADHSKKPTEFYSLIEARSQGPYLEVFARNTRQGWQSWGNDAAVQPQVTS